MNSQVSFSHGGGGRDMQVVRGMHIVSLLFFPEPQDSLQSGSGTWEVKHTVVEYSASFLALICT